MLRDLFPFVHLTAIASPKGIIIEGDVPNPQLAAKINEVITKLIPGGELAVIDLMKIEPQQVLLCVKVFEVAKDITSRVGINWQVLFQTSTQSLAFGSIFPAIPGGNPNYQVKGNGTYGNYTLSTILDMLEEDGVAKLLAEPNLTTVSGVKAQFFSGGEFPVIIPQGGQLIGTVTIEYKKYGMILEFTPEVDLSGLISLHVVPEVSELDKENSVVISGFVIPALITRKVDTIVKLWPGQSYLIAGLYMDQLADVNDSLYGLGKIPLIGSIFSSNDYHDRRQELLVMVTPYLINNGNGYPCPPDETPPPVAMETDGSEAYCPPPQGPDQQLPCYYQEVEAFIPTQWEVPTY